MVWSISAFAPVASVIVAGTAYTSAPSICIADNVSARVPPCPGDWLNFLEVITSLAPSHAIAIAKCLPIPLLAPVIRTILFFKLFDLFI